MAIIDLSGVASFPTGYTATAGSTWQAYKLDPRCRVVIVESEDASSGLYVAFNSMGAPASAETPADGGAVGTHRMFIDALGVRAFRLRRPDDLSIATHIYIAAEQNSPTYTISQELEGV